MFFTQRRRFLAWITAAVFGFVVAIGLSLVNSTTTTAQTVATLRIYAASSLTDVLPEIESAYNTANPSAQISFVNTFNSSGALLTQIQNSSNEAAGIPDIFIPASTSQTNTLQSAGKIASGWPKTVATNRLVLIRPNTPTSPAPSPTISSFSGLTNSATRTGIRGIAIGDPTSVPQGAYAREVLQSTGSGCGGGTYNTLLNSTTSNKLVFASNARNVLSAVQNKTLNGNTIDAGIVYITDQKVSTSTTQVALAPQSCHSSIVYPAAVLSRTLNSTAANSFANYLSSSTAKTIFSNRGFGTPT